MTENALIIYVPIITIYECWIFSLSHNGARLQKSALNVECSFVATPTISTFLDK